MDRGSNTDAPTRTAAPGWLVPLLVALVYLPALGSPSSGTHPDEAYYLGISAEMDAKDAWLTPTYEGEPKWYKPPLLYWAERTAYAAVGRGLLGGRLPVALSAIALALATGALARRMNGARAAPLATLLVATAFGVVKFGRLAMMDIPMALAFTAAAYGAWRACEEDRPRQLLWVGVGAGTSFMLKGPVGAVIVLLLAGGFLAWRRPRLLASRWTLLAFAVGAAMGLPWYVASLAVHGDRFFRFFFVDMNVDRFRHPWTLAGEATLVVGLLAFLLPWTLLVLAGVPAPRRWTPAVVLPLLWIAVVLLIFTIPALKWPHYGLACVPATALLASRVAPPRWAAAGTAGLLAVAALSAVAALAFRLPWSAATPLAVAAALLGAAAAFAWRRRTVASAGAVAVAYALVLGLVIPAVNPPVVPPPLIPRLAARDLYLDGPGYAKGLLSIVVGRPVRWVEGEDTVHALESGGIVIFTGSQLQQVPPALRSRLQPVARWERIPGYLAAPTILRSWRARDVSLLLEPVSAMELPASGPGRGEVSPRP